MRCMMLTRSFEGLMKDLSWAISSRTRIFWCNSKLLWLCFCYCKSVIRIKMWGSAFHWCIKNGKNVRKQWLRRFGASAYIKKQRRRRWVDRWYGNPARRRDIWAGPRDKIKMQTSCRRQLSVRQSRSCCKNSPATQRHHQQQQLQPQQAL